MTTTVQRKEIFGHPVGLFILFFTEMWERFSYYGMRAILVLYLIASTAGDNPGLGWNNDDALSLYGTYTMLVYLMAIPGGWLADRFIGQKKSVLYGGIILVAGHAVLSIEEYWAFYSGLGLIVLGVGMLKPNISTMVGGLYKKGDVRRDKGFTIFYIGINVGALLASLIVGYVGETYGWHYGFGLAAIGMTLGLIQYIVGQKYLSHIGNHIKKGDVGAIDTSKPLTKVEKDRIIVLVLSFFLVIAFWGAFEQAGGLMNIYAMEKTDRVLPFADFEIPASWFQSLNSFFIITLGTAVAGFWAHRKLKGKLSSSLFKMTMGLIIMGIGFFFMSGASAQYQADGSSAMYWLVFAYLFHTVGELCLSPVALSFITKLSPAKYASIMMGFYFAITGIGNKVAGLLGESASSYGEFNVFTGIGLFSIVVGGIILIIRPKIESLTHGAEDDDEHTLADPIVEGAENVIEKNS